MHTFADELPEGFPLDPGADKYLILSENGTPVHCLAIWTPADGSPADLQAFTVKDARKKGYFKSALRIAEETCKAGFSFLIPENALAGSVPALGALGARRLPEEYLLSLELSDIPEFPPGHTGKLFFSVKEDRSGALLFTFREKDKSPRQGNKKYGRVPAARCLVSIFGDRACFSSFSVRKDLRGQRLGEEALLRCLLYLQKRGIRLLTLHVTGDNEAALSLYKKTGFRTAETLFHYIL